MFHFLAAVLRPNQGQHHQGVGWDFRSGGDGESVLSSPVSTTVTRAEQKPSVCSNCRCDGVVLVHAVPASASPGCLMVREVTVPLPANKGVTVLLQP